MKIKIECPYAKYDEKMRLMCSKSNDLCANQRWKPCKGWSVLTEWAADCPSRKEKTNERKKSAGKKRTN